jgi:hypothetical protein
MNNFSALDDRSFDRPFFILAPPRSGSTLLFESMFRFDELFHFNHESDLIWWQHFPYEKMKEPSDYIGMEYVTAENIETIRRDTYNRVVGKHINENPALKREDLQYGFNKIRYLDKTIANCFHLHFLEKAFPSAQYILLVRDPRANISSMLEGWPYIERFGKPQLTHIIHSIEHAKIQHWTYPAPPGWQKIVTQTLPEICAWSWEQHILHVLNFFNQKNVKYRLIRYEDIVSDPINTFSHLAEELDVKFTDKIKQYIQNPAPAFTTVSKAEKDKWKRLNYKEIISLLPAIEITAKKLGYNVYENS